MSATTRLRVRRGAPAAAAPAALATDKPAIVPGPYAGLITRAIAFGVDAAIINAFALVATAIVALTFSVLNLPHELRTIAIAVGGFVYLLWVVGYFVTFWIAGGQTPGNRLMRIRVVARRGERLKPRRALLRFIGLTLAAIPLFAGYLMILVDGRRRGLQDVLARTLVVEAPDEPASTRPGRPRPPDGA